MSALSNDERVNAMEESSEIAVAHRRGSRRQSKAEQRRNGDPNAVLSPAWFERMQRLLSNPNNSPTRWRRPCRDRPARNRRQWRLLNPTRGQRAVAQFARADADAGVRRAGRAHLQRRADRV